MIVSDVFHSVISALRQKAAHVAHPSTRKMALNVTIDPVAGLYIQSTFLSLVTLQVFGPVTEGINDL
jgi:hypothetical protein